MNPASILVDAGFVVNIKSEFHDENLWNVQVLPGTIPQSFPVCETETICIFNLYFYVRSTK